MGTAPRTPEEAAIVERAFKALAAGSLGNVSFGRDQAFVVKEASGSKLYDFSGNEYIDYLLGLGPMILGHRNPVVTEAVVSAIRDYGTCFGLPYELEIEAAQMDKEERRIQTALINENSSRKATGFAQPSQF